MSEDMTDVWNLPTFKVDLPYSREATHEDMVAIMNNPTASEELKAKMLQAPTAIDSQTFQPYKVVDGVRYTLEAAQDIATRGF